MSKKFPRAKMTFFIWLALALPFLGWGYSAKDILKVENGRLTLRQTSQWGAQSRLIDQRTAIKSIDGRIAKNTTGRSLRDFELSIMDVEGNSVSLPDTMRMADWQVNRAVKHFNQAIHKGSHRINGYPYGLAISFGYIFLFISLLYGMESMKK